MYEYIYVQIHHVRIHYIFIPPVELTPRGRCAVPAYSLETPKRDRISDATYVSMHKYSRVPVQNVALQKPTRPAPRPPSLSNLPERYLKLNKPLVSK